METPNTDAASSSTLSLANRRDDLWNLRFEELASFCRIIATKNTTDLALPSRSKDWFRQQQRRYRKGLLPASKIQRLRQLHQLPPLERSRSTWEDRFQQLKQFYQQHGHVQVTAQQDPQLNRWITNQRARYDAGRLTPKQIAQLERLGKQQEQQQQGSSMGAFQWRRRSKNVPIEQRIQDWITYQQNHHQQNDESQNSTTTNRTDAAPVQHEYMPSQSSLGQWMNRIRFAYHRGTLSQDQVDRLNAVGFPWEHSTRKRRRKSVSSPWDIRYEELEVYVDENGHANISYGASNNNNENDRQSGHHRSLGRWIALQRLQYANGNLSTKQIEKLQRLGVRLSRLRRSSNVSSDDDMMTKQRRVSWDTRFRELQLYHQHHGHVHVTRREHKDLYQWINRQRVRFAAAAERQEEAPLEPQAKYTTARAKAQAQKDKLLALGVNLQRSITRSGTLSKEDKAQWNAQFKELVRFQNEYGHCNVLKEGAYFPLWHWVKTQRRRYAANDPRITKAQITKLKRINFPWSAAAAVWEQQYAALKEFYNLTGHSDVPHKWKRNASLGPWVSAQRQRYKANKMPLEQVEKMNSLEFEWELRSSPLWEQRYAELRQFHRKFNHTNVPRVYNPPLAYWVLTQRKRRKSTLILDHQEQKLDALQFSWNPAQDVWDDRFCSLVSFSAKYKHCNVPSTWPEDPTLGRWVLQQRRRYRTNCLPADLVDRLNQLDFSWEIRSSSIAEAAQVIWNERYRALEAFVSEYHHSNVPTTWPDDPTLGRWVLQQRRRHRTNSLPDHLVERLNQLSFSWDIQTETSAQKRWRENYEALVDFRTAHRHCNVPLLWSENPALGRWVLQQRRRKKTNSLPGELVERLNLLDFPWDTLRGGGSGGREGDGDRKKPEEEPSSNGPAGAASYGS